ncbi:MAG: haloacid dehalogenase type II [Thaumarchaeota archaeon]|nr:haloacid dehalogenase type II [Candidatus Calditenuaceae archaeon]MDW8187371.1 haloacid dehalogenase type II [Nitrososphaerota archaeon]
MKLQDVKAVTFDLFVTLFDWRGTLIPLIDELLSIQRVRADQILDQWRTRQIYYTMLDTLLGKGHTPFLEITRRSLVHTLKSLGIAVDRGAVDKLVNKWNDLKPLPEVDETLGALRGKGYAIAVLSNGDPETIDSLTKKLKVKFDYLFSAKQSGLYKPHPKIYLDAAERMRLRPENVAHVSSTVYDVVGSKAAGLRAIWIDVAGENFDEVEFEPDVRIRKFSELLDHL